MVLALKMPWPNTPDGALQNVSMFYGDFIEAPRVMAQVETSDRLVQHLQPAPHETAEVVVSDVPFTRLHVRIRQKLVADGLSKAEHQRLNLSDCGKLLPPAEFHRLLYV